MMTRRYFLAKASAVLPLAMVARRAHALAVEALAAPGPIGETLAALGVVVLPAELGDVRRARVVEDFRRWISGYREGAELTHGYGTSRLRFTGPTPQTRWAAQLDSLDAAARRRHGRSFARLPAADGEVLVRNALVGVPVDRMPPIAEAQHVALALLAFFYDSPEATDLCYGVEIRRQSCRPLSGGVTKPVVLRMGTRR